MKYTYELTLPMNFDPEELLKASPPSGSEVITADGLAFICDALIKVKSKYDEDKEQNGFVPLHSQILLSRNYRYSACIEYLVQMNVIERDNRFQIGYRSKGYKFTDVYTGKGFQKYRLADYVSKKRLRTLQDKIDKEAFQSCKEVRHLSRFFDPIKLKIDKEQAFQWIDQQRQLELSKTRNRRISKSKAQELEAEINYRCDIYQMMVEQFQNGEFHCSVDDSGKRFHSGLTNIKKELRQFITYDGNELIGLDISNSQPFLTLLLFRESFYKKSRLKAEVSLYNLFPEMYLHLSATGNIKKLKAICSQCSGLKRTLLDYEEYRKSVAAGTFYDDFLPQVNAGIENKHHLSRDTLKCQILTIFYGDVKDPELQKIPSVWRFRQKYPNVSVVFKTMMDRQYQDFSWLMQRIESRLVLHIITKRFVKENPGSPIFTIHDSLHTTADKIGTLKHILEQEMHKIIGETPKVKVEGENFLDDEQIPEFIDQFIEENQVINSGKECNKNWETAKGWQSQDTWNNNIKDEIQKILQTLTG